MKYLYILLPVFILISAVSEIHSEENLRLTLDGIQNFNQESALPKTAHLIQGAHNVSLIGRWAEGVSKTVFVKNNLAYIGDGSYLVITDISDPTNPAELSKFLLPSVVEGIYVRGDTAYIACSTDGLHIIDAGTPSNPVEIGKYEEIISSMGIFVSGNYAYIAAHYDEGLQIIDISNPSSPSYEGEYNTGGIAVDVAVSGMYAYVADLWGGLRIINISNPAAPYEAGSYINSSNTWGVCLSGDSAYIADGNNGLCIIDVSNPGSPSEIGSCSTGDYAWDVFVADSLAYVADGDSGLCIIYIKNPASPFKFGSLDTKGSSQGVFVSSDYAYIADYGNGLSVVDVDNPASPVEAGKYVTVGYTNRVFVRGNYAYVTDRTIGLSIIDVGDYTQPVRAGYFETDGSTMGVFVTGNYAYIADGENGLRVIDVSVPEFPSETGYYDTGGNALGIFINGNYAYVADGQAGLRVINITNPATPGETGYYDSPGEAWDVYVAGDYAYVADGPAGLRIIDVSTPSSPAETGSYDTDGTAQGVFVSGNFAYIADGSDGLRVIDVSVPSNPVETGYYITDHSGSAKDVYVLGRFAYVADSTNELRVVDISNPSHIEETGYYNYQEYSTGVFAQNDKIYSANGNFTALNVFKNELMSDSLLVYIPDSQIAGPGAFPGDTISIPVYVDTVEYHHHNGINSFQMELVYEDSLFSYLGYDSSGTILGNYGGLSVFSVQSRKDSGAGGALDTIRIAAACEDSIYYPDVPGTPFQYPRPLVRLKFRIYPNIASGDSIPLHFVNFMFNEGTPSAVTDDGSIKVQLRRYGDVDQNGVVQPFDAVLVLRHVIKDTALTGNSIIAAEVSGNGEITAYDAALILMYYVGKITTFPVGDYYKRALPSNRGAELMLEWGELKDGMLTLLVNARNLTEVYGYSMELAYDPAALEFQGAGLTEFTQGLISVINTEGGLVRFAAAGSEPVEGVGALVRLTFRVTGEVSGKDIIKLTELILNEELVLSNASSVSVPKTYALEQNYPNPFNPTTRILYQIPEDSQVSIIIYNTLGQRVKTLVNEAQSPGAYNIMWDGTNDNGVKLASGVYIYRMTAGNFSQIRKLVLMK